MIYVALLRGINVGGNNKVSMKDLKSWFEELGFEAVKTYINSGNIIFVSKDKDAPELAAKIENMLRQKTGLEIRVTLRSSEQIDTICDQADPSWNNDKDHKTDVMFLWPEIDSPDIISRIGLKPELETMKYHPGTLFWHIDRKNITKSRVLRMVGTPLYKQMTIRNINTLRKLRDLMRQVET